MNGSEQNRMRGIIFALSAGILWGFVPVYIHFLGDVDPLEVVAHRSLWSLVLLVGLVLWRRQMKLARQIFCDKKLLAGLTISTLFLLANWTVFVYAVQSGHVVSAALGYFIYPICPMTAPTHLNWVWIILSILISRMISSANRPCKRLRRQVSAGVLSGC
jgi:chloramphenicol-sensitive protein RarD